METKGQLIYYVKYNETAYKFKEDLHINLHIFFRYLRHAANCLSNTKQYYQHKSKHTIWLNLKSYYSVEHFRYPRGRGEHAHHGLHNYKGSLGVFAQRMCSLWLPKHDHLGYQRPVALQHFYKQICHGVLSTDVQAYLHGQKRCFHGYRWVLQHIHVYSFVSFFSFRTCALSFKSQRVMYGIRT